VVPNVVEYLTWPSYESGDVAHNVFSPGCPPIRRDVERAFCVKIAHGLLTLAAHHRHLVAGDQHVHPTGITNARTEGYNRLAKQVKRVGCGFRNPEHSARRIRFHCTRKQRTPTQTSC
jgi:Transposase